MAYSYELKLTRDAFNLQSSTVGEFTDAENADFRCRIVLSDEMVLNLGMRELACEASDNPAETPHSIYVTQMTLLRLQKGTPEDLFPLYHELGHIHHGHSGRYSSQAELESARAAAVRRGAALDTELEADSFAAAILGRDAAVTALRAMWLVRLDYNRRINNAGTPNGILENREYRNRIKAAEAL